MSFPAFAASITPDGAKDLQARFTKEIASRKDVRMAGMKAAFTGETSVTAKGTYYEAVMPTLKLTDSKNNAVNVGRIVMNMIPTDMSDEWKTSVALPALVDYKDARGKNSGTIGLGRQKASGIWDMKMFGLKKLDADYDGVTFKNAQSKDGYSAENVTVSYDMNTSPGGVSGPVTVTGTNLSLLDAAGKTTLLSPSIKVNSNVTADKNAAGGYTQNSHAEVSGLTNAINILDQKMKDPVATGKAQIQKAIGILTILQMSGKPGSGDAKSFDVVTNAQGQTLLNGVDVSLLLGAASLR